MRRYSEATNCDSTQADPQMLTTFAIRAVLYKPKRGGGHSDLARSIELAPLSYFAQIALVRATTNSCFQLTHPLL